MSGQAQIDMMEAGDEPRINTVGLGDEQLHSN